MLLRLSRLSLGFAAAAAALGLFGPMAERGLFADVALALGGVSFILWRAALAMRRRLEQAAGIVLEATPLDDTSLREAETLISRAAAEATSLDAALQRAGELLRGELGARAVRAFVVVGDHGDHGSDGGAAVLAELIAAQPLTLRAPRREVALDHTPVGRALRERRVSLDLPRSLVLPVVRDGRVLGLVELLGIEMTIDEGALARLLASTAAALAAAAGRAAIPPDADAPSATLHRTARGSAWPVGVATSGAAC